ncbi:MAG: hypothetical protein Fur0037_21080 [Planctomycetota bacterium]
MDRNPPLARTAIPALGLLAVSLLPAQDESRAGEPPVLRIQSREGARLVRLASALGGSVELDGGAPAGATYELSVGADRRILLRALPRGLREEVHAEIFLRPGAAASLFEEELQREARLLEIRAGFLLRQVGFASGAEKELLSGLRDLVGQTSALYAVASGDAGRPGGGLSVTADVTGEPGSTLDRWIQSLDENPRGAPKAAGSVLEAAIALDGGKAIEPLLGFTSLYGTSSAEERAAERDRQREWLANWDGSAALGYDGFAMTALFGVRDEARAAAMMVDPSSLQAQRASARRRRFDLAFTPRAAEHRGVAILKTVSTAADPIPFLPGGSVTSFSGAAGSVAFTVGGAAVDAGAAEKLVDALLDGAPRAPIRIEESGRRVPALAAFSLALDRIPYAVSLSGPLPEDERPARLQVHVRRVGVTLRLSMTLR